MNKIVEEMLMHYGMPRRSGRYPWGSGKEPYQRSGDFLSRVEKLKNENFEYIDVDGSKYYGEVAIAKSMGLTTTQLRTQMSLAKDERRAENVATAKALRDKGYSLNAIAEKMGYDNDSSVRALLDTNTEARMNQAMSTANFLREQVDKHGMIDVGSGVEKTLGISREKLREALYILELEGYNTFGGGVPQVTNKGKQTNLKVLCNPDIPYNIDENGRKTSAAIYDFDKIHYLNDYISYDQGQSFKQAFVYPESLDSRRIKINYSEDGGARKDGIIELRRGVEDISLGDSKYAQVRILVDGTHYIKGMAVYSDKMPPGVDVVFNTNKSNKTPMLGDKDNTVLKPIKKDDPLNPFGSLIKEHGGQRFYDDPNGKYTDPITGKKQSLSVINKRAEEGDWGEWSNTLSAQFLSKQPKYLVDRQLKLAVADKMAEFDEIKSLNNPTVKKALLRSFANDCDAAAVHLKAAALPRQKYQVILPIDSLKDNETYAPFYKNGETVALIRYPHGGTFEIPILKVNNNHKESISVLGKTPKDAIGINSKVAGILSGADFDGDTVMVIPCNSSNSKVKITATKPFEGLKEFDPKLQYGGKKEGTFKPMKNTQKEMGVISNLITDMTIKGAKEDELTRAVRHSMVVIDAEKHNLDYKQSEKDNGIAALKKKYQGSVDENGKYHEGASTLISKSKSQTTVPKRQGSPKIDTKTGELIWKTSDNLTYIDYKTGKEKTRMQKSTKMEETKDAYTLVSDLDNQIERSYANYANKMKALGNQARLELVSTGNIKYSSEANKQYAEQVKSLESQLNIALVNAPRERQAQTIANARVSAIRKENPDLKPGEIKKISQQSLTEARIQTGAKRTTIQISPLEWEAIQKGAISENKLNQIINNTDIAELREKATPRTQNTLSQAKINKIAAMEASGYTTSEIAEAVGVSSTTVNNHLKGGF